MKKTVVVIISILVCILVSGCITQTGDERDSLVQKGTDYFSKGDRDNASACFDKALQFDPNNITILDEKARTLVSSQNDEKLEIYDKILQIDPGNIRALKNKAEVFSFRSEYPEAIRMYDEIIAIQPHDGDAWRGKAEQLQYLGLFNEALAAYAQSWDIDVNTSIGWNKLFRYTNGYGRVNSTVEWMILNKTQEMDPENIDALIRRAEIYTPQKNYTDSLLIYDKAIELLSREDVCVTHPDLIDYAGNCSTDGKIASIQMEKGRIYEDLGDYENAITQYEKIRTHVSSYETECLKGIARSLYGQGKYADTIAICDRALEGIYKEELIISGGTSGPGPDPFLEGEIGMLSLKGSAFYHLGKYSDSRESFNAVFKLRPWDEDAKEGIQMIESAQGR